MTYTSDGDAIVDIYNTHSNEAFENIISIHEIIEFGDSHIIKGEFNAKYYIDHDKNTDEDHDSIFFEKAIFKVVRIY